MRCFVLCKLKELCSIITRGMLRTYKFIPIFSSKSLMLCHVSILYRKINHFSNFQNNFDMFYDMDAKVDVNLCVINISLITLNVFLVLFSVWWEVLNILYRKLRSWIDDENSKSLQQEKETKEKVVAAKFKVIY